MNIISVFCAFLMQCILKLKESSCPEAVELMELLHKENMRGILHVHDQVAMTLPLPVSQDSAILDRAAHYTDGSVKVVTLEKTSDPLVSVLFYGTQLHGFSSRGST